MDQTDNVVLGGGKTIQGNASFFEMSGPDSTTKIEMGIASGHPVHISMHVGTYAYKCDDIKRPTISKGNMIGGASDLTKVAMGAALSMYVTS